MAPVEPSTAFIRLFSLVDEGSGDRQALKRLRRRIRANHGLDDGERAELLKRALFVPGCKPAPVALLERDQP